MGLSLLPMEYVMIGAKAVVSCITAVLAEMVGTISEAPPFLSAFIPKMDIHTYPGQGLSLSQLTFVLNEELKRVAYCSS